MGVYIKGMEMPERCSRCPFSSHTDKYVMPACILVGEDMSIFEYEHERLEQCPLVPIPPHGDLVDRSEIEYPYQMHGGVLMTSNKIIGRLPAIIPTEEGEND